MSKNAISPNALSHAAVDKRLDILRLIGQTGSISQAARQAGVSYKAAWQAVHTLSNLAGVPLVDSAVGGAGGGGAKLTVSGVQLLEAAHQMEVARCEVMTRFTGGAAQALPGTSLRTSMRNNLPCVVARLDQMQPNDPMVRVMLAMTGGGNIASSITRESAELLGLEPGLAVLALCKATAVRISAVTEINRLKIGEIRDGEGAQERTSVNLIDGKVSRLSRGGLRDEVVMTLPGDLQLVGFADKPNRLRVGSKVRAWVEDNAVVLARV
ncbi:TOBE domain-containing protein [Rhodoferax sp.]|uniref:TOBE domain-containing protein n=1 Tax=Rhodoferax sp. TaxID=50421 RepID=UPI0026068332|nr:TOBE domain-containing protein [Rhodoferax sp.]MDD2918397.1 TOBE domain-containing protein [Rhodoferax sp.]